MYEGPSHSTERRPCSAAAAAAAATAAAASAATAATVSGCISGAELTYSLSSLFFTHYNSSYNFKIIYFYF